MQNLDVMALKCWNQIFWFLTKALCLWIAMCIIPKSSLTLPDDAVERRKLSVEQITIHKK